MDNGELLSGRCLNLKLEEPFFSQTREELLTPPLCYFHGQDALADHTVAQQYDCSRNCSAIVKFLLYNLFKKSIFVSFNSSHHNHLIQDWPKLHLTHHPGGKGTLMTTPRPLVLWLLSKWVNCLACWVYSLDLVSHSSVLNNSMLILKEYKTSKNTWIILSTIGCSGQFKSLWKFTSRGYSKIFYTCSYLGSNSLPFYIPFWAEKLVPLLYAYNGIDNIGTPFTYLV